MDYQDSDFSPLDEFPLRWRWTDPKYAELPKNVLSELFPLIPAKVADLLSVSTEVVGPSGLVQTKVHSFERFATEDEALTRNILERLTQDYTGQVVVLWLNEQLALLAPWTSFCVYWDDFCYPGSDDVLVLPLRAGWVMFHHHEEFFEFGVRRQAAG